MSGVAPDPPVPSDIDLRGLGWMPLMGDRLFASATWVGASDAGKIAALRLWWHSFSREIPASSLPDDDRLLASYAMLTIRIWVRLRAEAMRGWVQCSDGRWYHPVVAEIALDAWKKRQTYNDRRETDRDRLRKWRAAQRGNDPASPDDETPNETLLKPVSKRVRNADETARERDRTGERQDTPLSPPIAKRVSHRGNGHAKPSAVDNLLIGAARAVQAIEQRDRLAEDRGHSGAPPDALLDGK